MAITVREIRDEDLELIIGWRMDPDITKYMNTNPKLTLEGQRKWLDSISKDDSCMYWIVELDGRPVGLIDIVDIDWEAGNSSWGYYIGEKDARSLILAISLEMSLYDYVFDVLGFKELHNEVFSLNAGVVKLHIACGNELVREVKGEVEKEGVLYDITHLTISKDRWYSLRDSKRYEHIDFETGDIGGEKLIPHHVGVSVSNMEASIAKYRLLGYEKISDTTRDEYRHINITFLRSRHTDECIELIEPLDDQSPVTETLKHMKNVASPYHICYRTRSIRKMVSVLKRKGFFVTSASAKAPALEDKNVAFLMSRETGLIELLESNNE